MKPSFRTIIALFSGWIWLSCVGDSTLSPSTIVVDPMIEFESTAIELTEGEKDKKVRIALTKSIPSGVRVKVTPAPGFNLTFGNVYESYSNPDMFTSPTADIDGIVFDGPLSVLEFYVSSNFDTYNEGDESAVFTIARTEGIKLGAKHILTVTIHDGTLHDGLVAEYWFDQGDCTDTSGNGLQCYNYYGGLATTGKSGESESAQLFDGTTYLEIFGSSSINFGPDDEFTVSLWTEPASIQNNFDGNFNDIIRAWAWGTEGFPFGIAYYNQSAGALQNTFAVARHDGCSDFPVAVSNTVTSTFHHIVLRKNGGNIELYVDNVMVASTPDTTTCTTTNNSSLYIGCRGDLTHCYTGKVDDLRIYNRSLSLSEITALFNMP